MKLNNLGVGAGLFLGSLVMTVVVSAAFFIGMYVGRGTPANQPPSDGVARLSFTINVLAKGEAVDITIYERPDGKMYISQSPQ